jgi:pSer/pThr/pTyr-binding forkhead associated (FHA) protein
VRDIGSANGTRLNGKDLEPLTDTVLKDGDELTLGHWTRLSVKEGD